MVAIRRAFVAALLLSTLLPAYQAIASTYTVAATNATGTRTGLTIRSGDRLTFSASGNWCSGGVKAPGVASCGGPEGIRPAGAGETQLALNSAQVGTLLGTVGTWVFAIGAGANIIAQSDGELMLLMNDIIGTYGDNSGTVTANVTVSSSSQCTPTYPAPQSLQNGQTVSGSICPAGQQDVYYFDGQAGSQATITMVSSSAGVTLAPALELYTCCGTDGRVIASNDSATIATARINYALPTTGRYAIRAGSVGGRTTGSYTLTLSLTTVITMTPTLSPAAASARAVCAAGNLSAIEWLRQADPTGQSITVGREQPITCGGIVALPTGFRQSGESFDFGDGSPSVNGFPGVHSYAQPGSYTVTWRPNLCPIGSTVGCSAVPASVNVIVTAPIGITITPTATPTGNTASPTIRPGGVWVTPNDGATVAGPLHIEARAYPTNPGDPAISLVNFTARPAGQEWRVLCPARVPERSDVYVCDFSDPLPDGRMQISFDVYNAAGNSNPAPNGVRTITYRFEPTTPPLTVGVVVINPQTGPSGSAVATSGNGWPPNSEIVVYFDTSSGPIANAVSDAAGAFSVPFVVPPDAAVGGHNVLVGMLGSGNSTASTTFTVTQDQRGPALPSTMCGGWSVNSEPDLMQVSAPTSSGDGCSGAFVFQNETGIPNGIFTVGYTLELDNGTPENAGSIQWSPVSFLIPGVETHATISPINRGTPANSVVRGEMNDRSIEVDIAMLVLREAAPPCLDLAGIATLAVRTAPALDEVMMKARSDNLAFTTDLPGAIGEIFSQGAQAAPDLGLNCAGDVAAELVKKSEESAQVAIDVSPVIITWIDFYVQGPLVTKVELEYKLPGQST